MTEQFCREHAMHHETELRDPDCVFEDGFGDVIEQDDDAELPPEIPGFEGTRAALATLTVALPDAAAPGGAS